MKCKHTELLQQIEVSRSTLNDLSQSHPLYSDSIVMQSQELDDLLNEYNALLKQN
ncbi:Spo0E family sporulation regulatory protein-aspartic acid phosphatase [Alkalihalophilus lindianensis]|uniref:Spo0E family sporulation regulatory protein-aspartic acid phosphatase n=1 Tax=Alkalihalophilus lindianensis TaxID=1630542 RepID=UPI0034DE06DB